MHEGWEPLTQNADTLLIIIDLFFRGAVFHHGDVPQKLPISVNGAFPSLMGRFPTSMGRFPKCLNGPFSLLKIPLQNSPSRKGALRGS